MAKRRKQKLSKAERARRARQARLNFSRSPKRRKTKLARKKRTSRRSGSKEAKLMQILISGGTYGAARGFISNLIAPLTSAVPLGNASDEAATIAALWFARKNFLKSKGMKQAATAGMLIESASIGQMLISGELSFGGAQNSGGVGSGFTPTLG